MTHLRGFYQPWRMDDPPRSELSTVYLEVAASPEAQYPCCRERGGNMLGWFAKRRRQKRLKKLERAGKVLQFYFAEPIEFVAQEWTGRVGHMLHVSPDVRNAQSLASRIFTFEGTSPALSVAENNFPVIRQKIGDSVAATDMSEEEARAELFAGILAEALVEAGEDRTEVYSILFSM